MVVSRRPTVERQKPGPRRDLAAPGTPSNTRRYTSSWNSTTNCKVPPCKRSAARRLDSPCGIMRLIEFDKGESLGVLCHRIPWDRHVDNGPEHRHYLHDDIIHGTARSEEHTSELQS